MTESETRTLTVVERDELSPMSGVVALSDSAIEVRRLVEVIWAPATEKTTTEVETRVEPELLLERVVLEGVSLSVSEPLYHFSEPVRDYVLRHTLLAPRSSSGSPMGPRVQVACMASASSNCSVGGAETHGSMKEVVERRREALDIGGSGRSSTSQSLVPAVTGLQVVREPLTSEYSERTRMYRPFSLRRPKYRP